MHGNRIVYIIGFMGSGKTTAGEKLASLLGWSFIDLDKKIEEHTGNTIPEIFSKFGEKQFRNVEEEVLKSLKSLSDIVIATGGGAPCHSDNMDHMLETGLTIYLKLSPVQLKNRLAQSTTDRPLISNIDRNKLQEYIEEKLAFREKWYSRAEITHEGIDTDVDHLFSLVKSKFGI